jgi:hypothetical protein
MKELLSEAQKAGYERDDLILGLLQNISNTLNINNRDMELSGLAKVHFVPALKLFFTEQGNQLMYLAAATRDTKGAVLFCYDMYLIEFLAGKQPKLFEATKEFTKQLLAYSEDTGFILPLDARLAMENKSTVMLKYKGSTSLIAARDFVQNVGMDEEGTLNVTGSLLSLKGNSITTKVKDNAVVVNRFVRTLQKYGGDLIKDLDFQGWYNFKL